VDGGKAFEQPPDSASFIKKGKGKQSQPKPIALEPLNIDADSQVDLAVVEIEEDGQVRPKKKKRWFSASYQSGWLITIFDMCDIAKRCFRTTHVADQRYSGSEKS
jgi:hypothetical protein